MKEYFVTTFDTMTGKKVKVQVSKEVYTFYRRSAWNMWKNDSKRLGVEIPFSELDFSDDLDKYRNLVDPSIDPEHIVLDELLNEKLEIAMTSLEEEERDLINELFFHEKTEREYGEERFLSKTAVHYRKGVVLRKLRRVLKNEG